MKKYLISLEKDLYRRQLFFSQSCTTDFILFNAINTMHENSEKLTALFDLDKFKKHYLREVTKGEIGCTLSHLSIYKIISEDDSINDDEYCLICEDDALFDINFEHSLNCILKSQINKDIILLGQSKIPSFSNVELEISYPITLPFLSRKISDTKYKYAYPYKNYFAGTVAYLIKKSAVNKIINDEHHIVPFWLADDYPLFGSYFKLDICVIRPLLAIENPTLTSNLEDLRGSYRDYFGKNYSNIH